MLLEELYLISHQKSNQFDKKCANAKVRKLWNRSAGIYI